MADEDYVTQRRAEGKARAAGKKGIRTKATIKNNTWDSKFTRGDYVVYGAEKVVYSLNKHGRWEEIAQLTEQVAAQPPVERPPEEAKVEDADTTAAPPVASTLALNQPAEPIKPSSSRKLEPNQNKETNDTPVTAVFEAKFHLSNDDIIDRASSKPEGVNIPRFGFSGGGFYKSAGGRNFVSKKAVYCGDCCSQIGTVECDEAEAEDGKEDADKAEKSAEDSQEEDEGAEEEEEEEDVDNDDAKKKDNGTRVTTSKKSTNSFAMKDASAQPGEVWVQRSFKRGEYPLFRETRTQHSTPCMGCFLAQGPVWMLRGMGDKSRKKTKGFKKITRRDLSLHTD